MARAHAASACVQSDSIKGLAQSIAKPAYHRLLVAEPALRRAVPTLIIAFLITICLGAFVQVVDQNRQKRASVKRDLAAIADLLAERLDRIASVRQERAATFERLQLLLPGLIPSWAIAAGRHVIVTGADQRILARIPIDAAFGDTASILDVVSAALPLATAGQQPGVTDITLPNGSTALAIQHVVKALLPYHYHSGAGRFGLAIGRGPVGDAFRHHRLRRTDPRLRLPLAIDPRPRRRSHQ